MIKNNNRHTLNMFSAALPSPVEASVTGNRDNELRKIMETIGCSGEDCEPTESRRESSPSFEWEQDSPAGTIPRLLKRTASLGGLWPFMHDARLPVHPVQLPTSAAFGDVRGLGFSPRLSRQDLSQRLHREHIFSNVPVFCNVHAGRVLRRLLLFT